MFVDLAMWDGRVARAHSVTLALIQNVSLRHVRMSLLDVRQERKRDIRHKRKRDIRHETRVYQE